MFFYAILIGVPILNLLWWWWADIQLRPLPRARRWRGLLAALVLFQLSIYSWSIASRILDLSGEIPVVALSSAYIWHLIVLPFTMIGLAVFQVGSIIAWGVRKGMGSARHAPAGASTSSVPAPREDVPEAVADPIRLSRRQFLATAAAITPPLLVGGGVVRSLTQLDDFRIRRLELSLASLPRELDGLTIAHITDVHVGRYTQGSVLRRIAERTNELRADLVCLTGDLIDHDLADLPEALEMVRRLDPGAGLYMCEGNHDLFDSREGFESGVKAAGIPLLLNETDTVRVRGREVQVLGLKWGRAGADRKARRDAAFAAHLDETMALRNPDAFPILLAHHPHAFDVAAGIGLPLTLAGHTHGGQLMVTDRVGLAPIAFKYWSGLYRQGDSALVVGNGTGNWFPLRINAPAEVIHLTLRSAAS